MDFFLDNTLLSAVRNSYYYYHLWLWYDRKQACEVQLSFRSATVNISWHEVSWNARWYKPTRWSIYLGTRLVHNVFPLSLEMYITIYSLEQFGQIIWSKHINQDIVSADGIVATVGDFATIYLVACLEIHILWIIYFVSAGHHNLPFGKINWFHLMFVMKIWKEQSLKVCDVDVIFMITLALVRSSAICCIWMVRIQTQL